MATRSGLESSVGFKVYPLPRLVVSGILQFTVNNDGLRADVIYTGQIEYTFPKISTE